MKVNFSSLFLICLIGFFSSCANKGVVEITESPLNISEMRKTIVVVIGEPRLISENGRELTSRYYDRKEKPIDQPDKVNERLFTHIAILGDRRPYTISVEAVREKRVDSKTFEEIGNDQTIAARLANRIKYLLNQSRENRNVIDDFKPF